jgi:hypothetical protein
MPTKAVAFSKRITSPALSGSYALLYVMPTNMISVETEKIVGVFQGMTLATDPSEVTIDFYLTDPRPMLVDAQKHHDGTRWIDGPGDGWLAYDQAHAVAVRSTLEAMHQFTIPTGANLIGLSDDLVNIEDYKWVGVRVAYAASPSADVYVQITPQALPQR